MLLGLGRNWASNHVISCDHSDITSHYELDALSPPSNKFGPNIYHGSGRSRLRLEQFQGAKVSCVTHLRHRPVFHQCLSFGSHLLSLGLSYKWLIRSKSLSLVYRSFNLICGYKLKMDYRSTTVTCKDAWQWWEEIPQMGSYSVI